MLVSIRASAQNPKNFWKQMFSIPPPPDPLSAAALFIFHHNWPTNQDETRAGLLLWRRWRATVIYRQTALSLGVCLTVCPPAVSTIYSISSLHLNCVLYVAENKKKKKKTKAGCRTDNRPLNKSPLYWKSLYYYRPFEICVCVCVCSAAEGILITTINSGLQILKG